MFLINSDENMTKILIQILKTINEKLQDVIKLPKRFFDPGHTFPMHLKRLNNSISRNKEADVDIHLSVPSTYVRVPLHGFLQKGQHTN